MDVVIKRFDGLLEVPVDWSKVNWKQLYSFSDFKWIYGETPFSHFQFLLFMSVAYIVSIVLLQAYMKDRKAYSLKFATLVHNANLTILSFAMFSGAAYGAYLKYKSYGFIDALVCSTQSDPINGLLYYWSYIFYLSKFYEYIDTYLLVLKKKPLIFLHVWHHLTVAYVAWAGHEGSWTMALWTSTFWNSFVHTFMYSYYFMSTLGKEMWWKKYLTLLQIYQFVSGVFYTLYFGFLYVQNLDFSNGIMNMTYTLGCSAELWAVLSMFFVNNSYLVLFMKFYRDTYKARANRKPIKKD